MKPVHPVHSADRPHGFARLGPSTLGTQTHSVRAVPTIVLNGDARPIQTGQTVSDLLRELGLDSRQVAVERNREVVPRAEHGSTLLAEGDQLEVVTFVGGG